MSFETPWKFVDGQKKHTQDGCQLVALMKSIGRGLRHVRAIDVGSGDGIIAHDMLMQNKASFVLAIDIVPEAAEASRHNLGYFIERQRAEVRRCSAQTLFRDKKNWQKFDRFVINPPFFASGSGRANKRDLDQVARHETSLSVKLWARGAHRLLRQGGELYCVFPTVRLGELLTQLSLRQVEPKEIWWLKDDHRRRRFFCRAVRDAKPGLIVHW